MYLLNLSYCKQGFEVNRGLQNKGMSPLLSWRFPDKADQRAEPGSGWTSAELNHILQSHVVDGALSTFGCLDWESDLCKGVMRARCYPFDIPKHRFHGFNPQVLVHTLHRHVHTCYIHVCIISIWLIHV